MLLLGFSGLFLVGCDGAAKPELSLLNENQSQAAIPATVAESPGDEMEKITYVGEDFSEFAARDSHDDWCALLYIEPPANSPEDWVVGSSCASLEDFATHGVWFQTGTPAHMHTVQLHLDNFTGEADQDLERINDNLVAKWHPTSAA